MQKFFGRAILGLGLIFATQPASALFEARMTYSLLASKPDLAPLYVGGTSSIPSVSANAGMGGDILFFPPLLDWGFGARVENLGFKVNSGNLEYKSTANRTALLVSYSFIDTLLHVRTLFSYGLSHSGGMKVTESGVADLNWEPGSVSSYQVGLDVGVGLAGMVIGGEAGYQSMKWTEMADKNNSTANKVNTDMSGTYMKVYVGIGI